MIYSRFYDSSLQLHECGFQDKKSAEVASKQVSEL